jgi:hypothetical protein
MKRTTHGSPEIVARAEQKLTTEDAALLKYASTSEIMRELIAHSILGC